MSRLQDVLIRGIRADQPNANLVSPGTVYVVIDEDFLQEQSDGLVWAQFGPEVNPLGRLPYLDLIENTPVDPPADTARLYGLDVNGFTVVEVTDANANVVRLASDNILVGKVAVAAGIARGQLVYISGASGANPLLGLAKANAIATMPTVGLALDPGANNAFIRVLVSGTIQKLNTAGFAEGDSLFVSPTIAGDATTVLPVAPAFAQRVGFVTRAHATQGEILVLTTGTDGPPRLHAPTHSAGGTDPVAVTALAGYPGGTTTFLRADGSFAPPPAAAAPGMTWIEEKTPSGVSSVTFSSLGAFTHLKILMQGRTAESAVNTVIDLRFNGDTGANYDRQYYGAAAGSLIAAESLAQTAMDQVANLAGNTAVAGAAGAAEITIFDYRNTTFWKRVSSVYTYQQTTATAGLLGRTMGGNWRSTAAVTSITIQTRAAFNFTAGTKITLYGLQ